VRQRRPRGDALSHLFDADTRVETLADHVFDATISDRWNAIGDRPNGGYLLAVCLQALRQTLPMPDPLAVSAFFLRPTLPGPTEVRTDVARVGRRLAAGEARMLQAGQETVRVVATFTDLAAASGRTLVLADRPDLPPADECVDPLGGRSIPGISIVDVIGGYHEEDFELWDSRGSLVAQSRQLALLPAE